MNESIQSYAAWLLREVWGKGSTPRPNELARLNQHCLPGERPLDTVLRITGIEKHNLPATCGNAQDYYRQKAQEFLNAENVLK